MKKGYQNLKRMLSLIMVFAMILTMLPTTVFAAENGASTGETVTMYFENNWLWTDVRCYYWTSTGNNGWPGDTMKLVYNNGQSDIYAVQIPVDATGIIFNGIKNDGSGSRDQTPDLTAIENNLAHYMTWNGGNACGTYSINFVVAGAPAAVFGAEWNPGYADNAMALNFDTGLYEKTYNHVAANTAMEFKVTDGTWTNAWPSNNYSFSVNSLSNVTITFNAATKNVAVEVTPVYTVMFDTDGGSAVTAQNVEKDKTATEPAAPTKEGHTFDGWYSDTDKTTAYNFSSAVTADTTLYAKWTVNKYTVAFNSDGGSAVETQTVEYNKTASEPAAPTKEGYTFDGWYSDADKTAAYGFSAAVTADTTLYAKWTVNKYTVTFNTNGGSAVEAQSVEYGKTASKPTDPTRDGFVFSGWYTDENLTNVYDFVSVVKTDVTLYANWTEAAPDTYAVTFNSNGGSSVDTQTVEEGKSASKPTDPTKEGYTFEGWYTDEGLTAAYDFSTPVTANVTLYANWTINMYTVTFNSNEGSTVSAQMVEHGSKAEDPADPTREGYTFGGWYTDEGLTAAYDFASEVKADVTLYAKWDVTTYTVTFNTSGGSAVEAQTVREGETAVKPIDPTREGYTFEGWYTDEGLTTAYDFASGVEADVTIYAKWSATLITVYFRNDWLWTDVSVYTWTGDDSTNDKVEYTGGWPGTAMTYVETGADGYEVYKAEIPSGCNFVFNGTKDDGSGASDQSPNMSGAADGNAYYMHWDNGNKCSTFTYTPPVEGEKTTYTAIFHFANTLNWSPVNLYVWNDDGATTGSWPGAAMTKLDDNGYYTMAVSYDSADNKGLNYIINNGSNQTVDLNMAATAFDAATNTAEVWVELDPTANGEGKYVTKQVSDEPLDIVLAVSPRISGTSVTFEYAGSSAATSVEVRGTVTGATWDNGIAMTKNAKGLWTVTVEDLEPAVYKYKFVVNGSEWTTDPANGKTDAEGNSVFTITDPNAEDTNTVTINVFYDRADGIYVVEDADGEGVTGTWNAYVWGDSIAGTRYDFTADTNDLDGNGDKSQMVTTITVVGRDTGYVSLKTRLSTEDKDWLQEESEVKVTLDNIVSGTINVYVVSDGTSGNKGNTTYSVVTGTDIVANNKITDVSYDYDSGKVVVTLLETLTDPATQLEIVNKDDADDDIAIETIKTSGNSYTLTLSKELDLVNLYKYQIKFGGYYYDIPVAAAYASDKFAEEFTYDGDDLGASYTASGTTFKLWAPTAEAVSVNLYTSGTEGTSDLIKTVPMTRGEKGVWSVTVEGDQNGVYYTYEVKRDGETIEAVDPYARTTGVNGNRAMIIDLASTDPADGWSEITNKPASYTDAVIYELHVRDFSIDDSSGVKDEWQGKFLGLTQTGTTTANGVSTGLDYLKDLGITHLHLLPIYDYASVDETTCSTFNWGYDPQNYNVPEGSYSTDPYNGATRVKEMKEMVDTLHENNIGVIMDVVYNHVYNADTFCFNQIVPGYFSRVDSNASGCGNDTASEREMVRKFIVESVLYWAEEYHIDGFRFDLVGLLDTVTINQIVTEVHKVRPDIIFYGEGWDMDSTNKEPGTEMAKQGNSSKTPGFAYFSDSMRNNIGGNNGNSTGFASGAGNGATIAADWMANPWWTTNPQQIIQYASCHDNYTLVDKLILSTKASGVTSDIIKMNNLAAAFYMTSQGIPFIHAGEEFLREKLEEDGGRCENSYNASDYVNHIEWSNLEKETYADNAAYYKGLIAFRAAHPALRYDTAAEVSDNVRSITTEGSLLTFRIDGYGAGDDDIFVVFNANKSAKTVELPDGDWTIYINGEDAGTTALGTASGSVSVAGISAMVLTKPDAGEDEDEPLGASEEKTIYFSNNKGWEKVYAYAWTDGGQKVLLGTWPGTEMTYVKENEYGEKIYSVTLPVSETGIEGVIFTNNAGEQTVDIVPGIDGTGYYCTDKNSENKWEVGTYTFRAPNLGTADEYFLVGYLDGSDYVGGDYQFDENGQIKVTFSSDSYVYVVNGTNSETYMTDGYQGAVTSAILKDTAKCQLTQDKWDKLLIPGGAEVTVTMVKNDDNTVTLSYTLNTAGVEDTSGVQDGVTLHCWNWSFSEIEKNMATIAELGYTAIQTSPVQVMKEATNLTDNSVDSHWWVYYQPVDFVITTDSGNALGTKDDLKSMIETAHAYGIQVIVDVVANHLGNQNGNDLSGKIPEYLRKDEYWHDIKTDITNWNDRYDMTQHSLSGLPDLNTANDDIQGYVLTFLKECIDIGVDGFRFDMAKSIETPKDDASFASDFWPTVVGGAEAYADETYGKDLYIYGEVLDNPVISISAYTEYMAVTDNSWGNNLRNAIVSGTASMAGGYHKAADASNLVIWAESHDTFATDDAGQSSAGVSEANINKTWALVAARADAMGLYLARPESMDQALGVASVTGWDNAEVQAANLFHNAFAGQSESIGNESGISYVERGTSGVVLVNMKGNAADVSVTANAMADGTYTDQITGNVFTVANGKITGKIGDTGIAVVYNQTEYKIIKGAGSTWTQGTKAGLEFTANGPYEKFTDVAVDGKLLSSTSYESKSGSTVVTLKASYLDTLAVGEHTLTVRYVDGNASCTFSVKAVSTETTAPEESTPESSTPESSAPENSTPESSTPESSAPESSVPESSTSGTTAPETTVPETTAPEAGTPPTGDNSGILFWSMMVLFSAAAAAALISMRKRFGEEE